MIGAKCESASRNSGKIGKNRGKIIWSVTASCFNMSEFTYGNHNINLDQLFQLGQDFASPNPTIQLAAAYDTLSVLVQVSPPPGLHVHTLSSSESANQTFSSVSGICPPSSHTSLVSSAGIMKGKARVRTPALSAKTSSPVTCSKPVACTIRDTSPKHNKFYPFQRLESLDIPGADDL